VRTRLIKMTSRVVKFGRRLILQTSFKLCVSVVFLESAPAGSESTIVIVIIEYFSRYFLRLGRLSKMSGSLQFSMFSHHHRRYFGIFARFVLRKQTSVKICRDLTFSLKV